MRKLKKFSLLWDKIEAKKALKIVLLVFDNLFFQLVPALGPFGYMQFFEYKAKFQPNSQALDKFQI